MLSKILRSNKFFFSQALDDLATVIADLRNDVNEVIFHLFHEMIVKRK